MKFKVIFIILSCLSIFINIRAPYIYDYNAYTLQWEEICLGCNPWARGNNPYGITNIFFAAYYNLHHKFPGIIFLFFYLLANYLIVIKALSKLTKKHLIILLVILFVNPFFCIYAVQYRSNDVFVAGVLVIAMYLYEKSREGSSGTLLAIATHMKFIPLFVAPFLIFEKRKITSKFFISYTIAIVGIGVFGFLMWGDSILFPIYFNSSRGGNFLSIYAFIKGNFQPLSFLGITNLDKYSIYTMALGWLVSFFIYLRYSFDKTFMSVFALSNVIAFYKVGHFQFYIPLFLLFIYACVTNYKKVIKYQFLLVSSFIFWGYLFFLAIFYYYTGLTEEYLWTRDYIGLPLFICQLTMNISIIFFLVKLKTNKI